VVGDVLRRLVNGIVVLLAGLAFFLVPVGGKTAAQHAMAIGASKPAREAATAFAGAAMAIADRAGGTLLGFRRRVASLSLTPRLSARRRGSFPGRRRR